MYCNECGKYNSKGSKFCQHCGKKLLREIEEDKITKESTKELDTSSDENEPVKESKGKVDAGLGGWLALVGLGLIINPFFYGYQTLSYFPLFNQTYDIPGYLTLLQFEFLIMFASFALSVYLLILYFKKKIKFPKYYILFLIGSAIWVVIDHIFLASLSPQTAQEQKAISDALSQNSGTIGRSILAAIIWVSYMKKSKRVKATFINK